MINLLTRIETPWDACSFYRSTGPFQHLRTIMNIQYTEPTNYNWLNIGMSDMAFLQRPYTDMDLQLVRMCKSLKKPIIVDYDDDLFSIPPWNPAHNVFGDNAKDNIKEILGLADAVTVTTEYLAMTLNKYRSKPCTIIPNAFPNHLVNFKTSQKPPRQKIITWRGSNTHYKDISIARDGLLAALEMFPDWRVVFLGDPPYEFVELFGDKAKVVPTLEPIPYLNTLFSLAPSIHIVPLIDDDFNRSKSNIAYLEATFAGAAVLSPSWDEWHRPGCWNYSGSPENFKLMLLDMINYSTIQSVAECGHKYVGEHLMLDQVNLRRKKLFESFV